MPKPRIVGETRKPIPERRPPTHLEARQHEWLSEESRTLHSRRASSGRPFSVYLSASAERKVREHASKESRRRLEVMGLLLGEVCSWEGEEYSIITDCVTTELKSSQAKVRFDPEAFPKLFGRLDESGFDYRILGWYHSHPGHTCFLSLRDLETQKTMFTEPYHCALVIDPINREVKAFRLSGEGYEEVPFAIVTDRVLRREIAMKRVRRLKMNPVTEV